MSRFESVPLLRDLLNIVLFCSQLERPVPLDFLIKALGTELITNYPVFSEVFTKTALVDEIDLDEEGSLALATLHQLHALWLLRGLFPERSGQLSILEQITASEFTTPISSTSNDLLVRFFKISPSCFVRKSNA